MCLKTPLLSSNHLDLTAAPEPGVYRVASGSLESLQVWDALTGANAKTLATGWMLGVSWSPDGKKLAVFINAGGGTQVVDASNGAVRGILV